MPWTTIFKPSFMNDFVELPKNLQKQIQSAHAELEQDPVTPRGDTIKKLQGWENLWRYRLGGYRLIYSAVHEQKVVQLLAVGPRKDVYPRFERKNYTPEMPNLVFGPELAKALEPHREIPEWQNHPEWMQPKVVDPESNPLPRRLSPSLLATWHIDEAWHAVLARCKTEDELDKAPLPDDVYKRVLDGLFPAEVEQIAAQPDYVLFNPADLEKYAEGTLRGFLLHLDEDQRRFVDWSLRGPTLVKGGPGSGKSTVAMYRVRAVIEHRRKTGGVTPSVLFTTYTNPLINFSQSLLHQLLGDVLNLNASDELPKDIKITTVDKLATWIVRHSGKQFNIAGHADQLKALEVARLALKPKALGDLEKAKITAVIKDINADYLLDEFDWVIEGRNCVLVDDYVAANRAGRGTPFNQTLRGAVWQLYQAYRAELAAQDLLTWGQLRQLALAEVYSGNFSQRWDYVIVDEAQDLTPAALAFCVELCADPGGVFLTADANQSLYNRGFKWQDVHTQLKVAGRTRMLKRNYRSTREIAQAAACLLTGANHADDEALQQTYVHHGSPAVLYAADGATDQARWLAAQICHALKDLRLPVNAAAVLVPSGSLGEFLAEQLQKSGLPAKFVKGNALNLEERCVKVTTLHSAKGLEFPVVAIAHVEADRLPKESGLIEDAAEHLAAQQRLFYVGCTRAMRYLFVTYDRSLPSSFIELLSDESWYRF